MSLVIDFNRFSGKAQVRRATLSCDSSYLQKATDLNYKLSEICVRSVIRFGLLGPIEFIVHYVQPKSLSIEIQILAFTG